MQDKNDQKTSKQTDIENDDIIENKKVDEFSVSKEHSAEDKKEYSFLTIGDELVRRGLITQDQLEVALKQQEFSGDARSLDYILVDLGFTSNQGSYLPRNYL